jgi:hypothetical protein
MSFTNTHSHYLTCLPEGYLDTTIANRLFRDENPTYMTSVSTWMNLHSRTTNGFNWTNVTPGDGYVKVSKIKGKRIEETIVIGSTEQFVYDFGGAYYADHTLWSPSDIDYGGTYYKQNNSGEYCYDGFNFYYYDEYDPCDDSSRYEWKGSRGYFETIPVYADDTKVSVFPQYRVQNVFSDIILSGFSDSQLVQDDSAYSTSGTVVYAYAFDTSSPYPRIPKVKLWNGGAFPYVEEVFYKPSTTYETRKIGEINQKHLLGKSKISGCYIDQRRCNSFSFSDKNLSFVPSYNSSDCYYNNYQLPYYKYYSLSTKNILNAWGTTLKEDQIFLTGNVENNYINFESYINVPIRSYHKVTGAEPDQTVDNDFFYLRIPVSPINFSEPFTIDFSADYCSRNYTFGSDGGSSTYGYTKFVELLSGIILILYSNGLFYMYKKDQISGFIENKLNKDFKYISNSFNRLAGTDSSNSILITLNDSSETVSKDVNQINIHPYIYRRWIPYDDGTLTGNAAYGLFPRMGVPLLYYDQTYVLSHSTTLIDVPLTAFHSILDTNSTAPAINITIKKYIYDPSTNDFKFTTVKTEPLTKILSFNVDGSNYRHYYSYDYIPDVPYERNIIYYSLSYGAGASLVDWFPKEYINCPNFISRHSPNDLSGFDYTLNKSIEGFVHPNWVQKYNPIMTLEGNNTISYTVSENIITFQLTLNQYWTPDLYSGLFRHFIFDTTHYVCKNTYTIYIIDQDGYYYTPNGWKKSLTAYGNLPTIVQTSGLNQYNGMNSPQQITVNNYYNKDIKFHIVGNTPLWNFDTFQAFNYSKLIYSVNIPKTV